MKYGLEANIKWKEMQLKQHREKEKEREVVNLSTTNEEVNSSVKDEFQFNLQSANDLKVEMQKVQQKNPIF